MKKQLLAFALLAAVGFSCKKDKEKTDLPPTGNDQELITTVKLTLVNASNSSDVREVTFTDLDGPGGNAPVQTALSLDGGVTYNATIELLNESVTPSEDITQEVIDEAEDHQFFYSVNGSYLTIAYDPTDDDANGVPLGVRSTFTTTFTAETSTFRVTLKHQPGEKPTTGNGDINLGETDIEVDFSYTINPVVL